ncbi:STM4015 family protein [Actinocorallia populi]|uniref:STM4015 family protein n=1 Tax=Actinocorallia populi TaxID=2079200 RepID=UPI000D08CA66|nr:STM4015 family protein [Actinocorallia populi]
MPNHRHLTEFAGLPAIDFPSVEALEFKLLRARYEAREEGRPEPERLPPDEGLVAAKAEPGAYAWRLRLESSQGEECFRDQLDRFIDEIDTTVVTALLIGDCWNPALAQDDVDGVRDLLVDRAAAFPALTALFFGEILEQESGRISWIAPTDVSPLLAAFPGLSEFVVRGGDVMVFGTADGGKRTYRLAWNTPRHDRLRRLTLQTHRLDPAVARGVLACELPALEHLELYLGAEDGDGPSPEDLAPLLTGVPFPALRSLGLRNAQDTDALVAALADAPLTGRLTALDLSLGTLGDKGAQILLDAPVYRGLEHLDLHHHYLSEAMADRLHAHFTAAGVAVDLGDRQELEEWDDEDDEEEYEDESRYPAIPV